MLAMCKLDEVLKMAMGTKLSRIRLNRLITLAKTVTGIKKLALQTTNNSRVTGEGCQSLFEASQEDDALGMLHYRRVPIFPLSRSALQLLCDFCYIQIALRRT